jgi:regulator of nonsense transcripts 2
MDIEFIIQDVFALTRPQWKLASNLEEASRAFQLAIAQNSKTSGLDKVVEPEDPESDGASDDENDNEIDTNLPDGDEESESEDEIELGSNGDALHSATVSDSEEENIIVTRQEEEIDPEDEADFEREYAKMMAESLESRKHERKSTFDVPLPMRRKDVSNTSESWVEESANGNPTPPGTMAFSLLTKRGNRQQVSSQPSWSISATNNVH